MKWITRKHIHVNRTATVWLVRRFLDPEAEVHFVEPEQVAPRARELEAVSFDAPGARYPHKDRQGRCSFEQLVAERLSDDPALARLAKIVHGADFPEEIATRLSTKNRCIQAIPHSRPGTHSNLGGRHSLEVERTTGSPSRLHRR